MAWEILWPELYEYATQLVRRVLLLPGRPDPERTECGDQGDEKCGRARGSATANQTK
jgi:hypothetical protein